MTFIITPNTGIDRGLGHGGEARHRVGAASVGFVADIPPDDGVGTVGNVGSVGNVASVGNVGSAVAKGRKRAGVPESR